MNKNKMLYWHNGLFLKPHHFQYMQHYINRTVDEYTKDNHGFDFGINNINIDVTKLSNYKLSLLSGSFLFDDGTLVNYPSNAVLSERDFSANIGEKSYLKCYIGIKNINYEGNNVTLIGENNSADNVDTRFLFNKLSSVQENNMFEDSDSSEIDYLEYSLRIFFEDEIDNIYNYSLLPIAVIENKGGDIILSKNFVPPLINVNADNNFRNLLSKTYSDVVSHINKLESYKVTYNTSSSVSYIPKQILALQTMSEYVAEYNQYLDNNGSSHPLKLHQNFCKVISKLSVFSNKINLLCQNEKGQSLIIKYDHNKIFECFDNLSKLLLSILKDIDTVPEKSIDLVNEDHIYYTNIPSDVIDKNYDFYLKLVSKDIDRFRESLSFAKISNKSRILDIVTRSLPGIGFQVVDESSGLSFAKDKNSICIKIDSSGEDWLDIRNSKDISIFFDYVDKDAKVSLFTIKKDYE